MGNAFWLMTISQIHVDVLFRLLLVQDHKPLAVASVA